MEWETVIGLEVHTQLATHSKIFSRASTAYGAAPNTQACTIDLGFPGVLPVLNRSAVDLAIKLGLAIDAKVNLHSVFSRKHYFYPDLPKGYQISQYDQPIVGEGYLDLFFKNGTQKRIGIERAHLEEDAGKSLHEDFEGMSGIDLNRAGTPLLEIVSKPDMRSAEEAVTYMKTLHALLRYLEISDGNMQEGSFRCDVNISVMPKGSDTYGTRAEIKNLNSFRFVERAIEFERARQINLIESGGTVVQETRLYDAAKHETRSLRSKENAHDYRYFPDPDLLPLVFTKEHVEEIKKSLPELPQEKRERFQECFGLSTYDASVLVANKSLSQYFEATNNRVNSPKIVANWVMGEVSAYLNKEDLSIEDCPISPERLSGLLVRLMDNTLSSRTAKTVFELMWSSDEDADTIIDKNNLRQVSDADELSKIIASVLEENPNQLAQYRSGKEKLFGYFVGQAMKKTQGRANPSEINALLKEKLQE